VDPDPYSEYGSWKWTQTLKLPLEFDKKVGENNLKNFFPLHILRFCQFCGYGMFIPDPDFYPSRIPDPKIATKERGEKKFVVIPFL
jgi:hypothetical protein